MNIISLSWVITGYILASAILVVPFGRLADIVGRKKIFMLGAAFFTITTVLCGLAYSGTFLIFARMLQGASSAMIMGTATALLISMFPAHERGKALGINVSGVYLGSLLAPSLGGIMTQYWGWRSIFFMTAALSVIVISLAWRYLEHELPESHGESFDLIGALLYALSFVSLLYGITRLPALNGILLIALGIALFAVFCIVENRTQHPVFDLNLLLKNKPFAMSSLAAFLNFSAIYALTFLMSLYLQYIRCIETRTAGLILLATPITTLIGAPLAGRLSDKIDPSIIASYGMAVTSGILLLMSLVMNTSTPVYLIMFFLVILGIGSSLFATPNTNAAMSAVAKKHLGVASSIVNSMRSFGQTISMGITTFILTMSVGKIELSSQVAPYLMTGIRIMFFVSALFCLMGTVASLTRRRCQIEQ